jgi:xylan 1,4-beta-xylosidase
MRTTSWCSSLGDSRLKNCRGIAAEFSVDVNSEIGVNHEFWKSAGYDFLFKIVNEPEGQEFLDRAQKNRSIRYYRTHYTFNNRARVDNRAGGNVCGDVVHKGEDGNDHYDFSRVNRTFHEYVKRGMKPIVEFDYYPDGFSAHSAQSRNDEALEERTGPPANWAQWQELLERFMQNLVSEFGKEELRSWYFEVWNEPDGWPSEDVPFFFRMYDVFAHTVKSYDPGFRVGGPACYHLYFMKEFLDHVVHGTNHVTGRVGSPVDFLSFHIYGLSGSWLQSAPEITPSVAKFTADMLWWQRLMKNYPALKGVEIHLNEWGLCSHGDSKFVADFPQLEYRNSEVSALFLVKLVDCLYAIEDNYDFRTDLMLYWGAWFNAATGPIFMGSRDLMTSGNTPKPILTAYEMLAKLGSRRVKVAGPRPGGRHGLLATKSNDAIQLVAYNFQETDDISQKDRVIICLENLPSGRVVRVEKYPMDSQHNNTYRQWERMGRPPAGDEVISELRTSGELNTTDTFEVKVRNNRAVLKDTLPRHSMCLYICNCSSMK